MTGDRNASSLEEGLISDTADAISQLLANHGVTSFDAARASRGGRSLEEGRETPDVTEGELSFVLEHGGVTAITGQPRAWTYRSTAPGTLRFRERSRPASGGWLEGALAWANLSRGAGDGADFHPFLTIAAMALLEHVRDLHDLGEALLIRVQPIGEVGEIELTVHEGFAEELRYARCRP